jgi:hypothetical protein
MVIVAISISHPQKPLDQFKINRRDLFHLINPTDAAAFSLPLKNVGCVDL